MEICREIEHKEPAEPDKHGDLFYALLNGQTVKETIETSRGSFVIRYPKPKDFRYIAILAARKRAQLPSGTLDKQIEEDINRISELDAIIESGPAWYENAKKKNPDFSFEEVPDVEFISELYVKAYQFREGIRARLRGNKESAVREADNEAVQETMGDGIFQGVAAGIKRDKR